MSPVSDRNGHPVPGTRSIRHTRRAIFGTGAAAAMAAVVAACSPARSLPANPGARVNGAPAKPRATDQSDPASQTAVASRTPAPHASRINPPHPTVSPAETQAPVVTATTVAARDYAIVPTTAGTVQFVHGWDGPRTPLIEAMMSDFGIHFPQIEIEADPLEPTGLRDWLVTALASGSPPNTVMLRSDSVAYFAEQRALLPLDAQIARDRIQANWFAPHEVSARTWDGRVYGLPHVAAGAEQLLFVNTGLLDRLGRDPADPIVTWQQVASLVEPARLAGALALDPTRCGAGVSGFQVWTYANGGRWLDDAGKRVTWADSSALEAAAWIQRMVMTQRGIAGLPPVGENPSTPLSAQEWLSEKHVCCVNDAGWIYQLQQVAPQLKFAVYELPRNADNPASDGRSPTFGGWMLAIPREAQDHAAAWEWLKFAAVSEAADRLASQQGMPSALVNSPARTTHAATTPFTSVIDSGLGRSVPVPSLPISAHLDDIARTVQAEIIAQQRPPQPMLESAARTAQQVLDAWNAKRRRP